MGYKRKTGVQGDTMVCGRMEFPLPEMEKTMGRLGRGKMRN